MMREGGMPRHSGMVSSGVSAMRYLVGACGKQRRTIVNVSLRGQKSTVRQLHAFVAWLDPSIRHARACRGHPDKGRDGACLSGMAGTGPAMTMWVCRAHRYDASVMTDFSYCLLRM